MRAAHRTAAITTGPTPAQATTARGACGSRSTITVRTTPASTTITAESRIASRTWNPAGAGANEASGMDLAEGML